MGSVVCPRCNGKKKIMAKGSLPTLYMLKTRKVDVEEILALKNFEKLFSEPNPKE